VKRPMLSLVVLVISASIAQAQSKWVHADFFRITEGKVTEYRAEQAAKTMPQHQQLVNQGKSYAMIAYLPLFPDRMALIGSNLAVDGEGKVRTQT